MDAMNGVAWLPQPDMSPSLSAPNKRKRTESLDNPVTESNQGMGEVQDEHIQQTLRSVLLVLRRYDSSPSLLQFALPPAPSDEPTAKRVRLSPNIEGTENIESRIEAGSYSSIDAVMNDFNKASDLILATFNPVVELVNGAQHLSSNPHGRFRDQVAILKQMLHKLLRLEIQHVPEVKLGDMQGDAATGIIDGDDVENRLVLTLTTQTEKGPRQLWSGVRHSVDLLPQLDGDSPSHNPTYPELRGKTIPNGIKIAHAALINQHETMPESKESRTLGDVFKPHRSVKSLEPPRPAKNPTRGSALTFVSQSDMAASEKATPIYKSDYRYASLPAGQWLHYNNAGSASQIPPEAKRRQRDHALSFGEGKAEVPVEELLEHEQVKTKALFQAAYSSFAPAFDNSASIIPEQTRSQLWWDRTGQKRFNALLSIQYPVADLESSTISSAGADLPADDDLEHLVASYEPESNPLIESQSSEVDPKDVDDLLQEITDLLETLSSYQRIRNLSSPPRQAVAELPKPANSLVNPPSAESDTYETLRSSLSLLVGSLPPYAVAKLDGDQLETLNISTTMVLENTDYAGTMEKDDFTLQRQKASATATISAAGRAGTSVSSAPGRPGNYSTPATTTPSAVAYNQRAYAANPTRASFQQPPRPSMPNYSSSNSTNQPFQTPRPPSSTSQRPSYPQQQIPHPTPNHSYSQTPSVPQYQRPNQNGYVNYGGQTGTPSQPAYAQRASQPSYQQRAQDTVARSASPQKPVMNGQPSYFQRSQQPQTPNYPSSRTPPVPYTNSTDQQTLIDRAKAQQPPELQRQISGQSQTPGSQFSNMGRSLTPGGQTMNGRPVAAAGVAQ